MSGAKEIRTKIGSVKNTQKITKAMEMVAASKLRRTQQRMAAAQPYAEKIRTADRTFVPGQSGLSSPVPGGTTPSSAWAISLSPQIVVCAAA